ncbi:HNH endonuclease signature motif containing protein [uncultured Metabacillus sp.]|uniref:HNH endonuclease signature motif containing protein n=1 Tax=uncultured Metabacillus sp. TaxID=2860135 RepID=UPI002601638A|nr:HNH endonuclease signature motif containing protein [uncultured Metabacillus sp.]
MALSPEEKQKRAEERKLKKWNDTHKLIDGVDHKICNRCNEHYPSTNEHFYKNDKNGIDGLYPYCKKCALEHSYDWRENNREGYLEQIKRRNSKPKARKRIYEANKRRQESGEFKKWQQDNKDKLFQYRLNRGNKRHKINKQEWEQCKAYFDNSCAYCGITYDDHKGKFNEDLHKEHVNDKGADDLSNCVPACKRCNSKKHIYSLEEWYPSQEFYSEGKHEKINNWLSKDYKLYIKEKKPRKPYTRKSR